MELAKRRKGSTALKGLGVKFGATVRKRYGKVYRTLKLKRRCPSWYFTKISENSDWNLAMQQV